MPEPYVILDVSNIAYRTYHGLGGRHSKIQLPATYGVLKVLGALARTLQSTRFLFCFDSDQSVRKEIHPPYKSNRAVTPDRLAVKMELTALYTQWLPKIGYSNLYFKIGYEADDLIASCVRQVAGDCIIVSNDSDLFQLLEGSRVMIWSPLQKAYFTELDLWEKHKLCPSEWVSYISLTGCDTDNIDGITGVGPVTAWNLMRQGISTISLTASEQETLKRNRRLITLPCPLLSPYRVCIRKDEVDYLTWNAVVSDLNLDMLLDKMPVT